MTEFFGFNESYCNLLKCPVCAGALMYSSGKLLCTSTACGQSFPVLGKVCVFLDSIQDSDTKISQEKWDVFYNAKEFIESYEAQYQKYVTDNYENVYNQLSEVVALTKQVTFLEIGCGPMFLARALSGNCGLVIGVDFSLEALKTAQLMLDGHGITNYLLILGDIKKMPLRDNVIDVLYGGGVIEHFKDTQVAVNEMYRVLKNNGVAFNTVPYLNLGSLTYRQLWGNIPNFPGLKQTAEFIHIKLLKTRHMRFGYEFSFMRSHIQMLHQRAGFRKVAVRKFETKLMFEFVPSKQVRRILIWLADKCFLFWPMIKVIAVK